MRAPPERVASPPQRPRHTNPLAVAALVCGVYPVLMAAIYITVNVADAILPLGSIAEDWLGMAISLAAPTAAAAILLGAVARRQTRATGEAGRGLATTGMVLGIIDVVVAVLLVIAIIQFLDALQNSNLNLFG